MAAINSNSEFQVEPDQSAAATKTKDGFQGGKRGGKRQSPSQRKHGKQRNEEYRGKKADEANAIRTQALKDKLFFGFRESTVAMANMQMATVNRSMIIPVSSRAVGFMCQFMFCKFARIQLKIPLTSTVYALYRVVLIQFECKLVHAMGLQSARTALGRYFEDLVLPGPFLVKIGQMGANLACFVNLISALGVFKCYGTQYIPRLARMPVVNCMLTPDPTLVTFSNLRSVVTFLSTRTTSREARKAFYDMNPLPGAIWGGQPTPGARRSAEGEVASDFPLLMNPDDFIGENYTTAHLAADIDSVQDLIEVVGRKYPKYVSEVAVDYDAPGHPNQLVSNDPIGARCADLPVTVVAADNDGTVHRAYVGFNVTNPVQGEEMRFWSPETLSEGEFYMGILHLLGERRVDPPESYAMRSPFSGKQECDGDYIAALSNFLG